MEDLIGECRHESRCYEHLTLSLGALFFDGRMFMKVVCQPVLMSSEDAGKSLEEGDRLHFLFFEGNVLVK